MHCSVNSSGVMQQLQKQEALGDGGAGADTGTASQKGLTKMSSSTTSTEPCSAAWCSGVQLPWSFITISCLPAASRRDATMSTWPISAAKCRGVCRLLDVLHTLAFCWMSIFTSGNQPVDTKQNQTVSVVLQTLVFCWMSILQPATTSLNSEQGSVDSVSCIRAEMVTLMLDGELNDRSSTS